MRSIELIQNYHAGIVTYFDQHLPFRYIIIDK